ncbi:hypothetical protein H0E84_10410 [Luteimonas sp. SJ-92]|uniref:Uncharacterized protein n=1 Tax=Luteimonas salinisoli TaxID=2752307 RepID=A0A853JC26_9GAMM|nr:hypothetical protein [Luteimonas salinisoli]NZA26796.1 hypothetical protein [Luteimonas salinisoli]
MQTPTAQVPGAAPATATLSQAAAAAPAATAVAHAAQSQAAHPQALPGQAAALSQQAVAQAAPGARGEAVSIPGAPGQPSGTTPAQQSVPVNPALTVPARAEGAMADRGATMLPGAPATTTAAAPGATQAAAAIALTHVAVPASQSPGEAKGVTLLAGGEQRAQGRVDGVAHGHTVTLAERRPRLSLGLGGLIAALGMRDAALRERHQAELAQQRLVERIFQWLYWVLAITAYGCLAMAILIFLPVFDADVARSALPAPGPWVGGFATLGLIAGFGAWMLARRLK